MIELVDLSAQSAVLIGRRAAAFVLLERVERLDPRLVEIELVLRVLNLGRDRIAPGRRRFRELRLQTVDPSADRLAVASSVSKLCITLPRLLSPGTSAGVAEGAAAAEFGVALARYAACARAYSKASLRTSPAVWRSSAKNSVSSGSRTSCASVPRFLYQLITSLRYEITVCASGRDAAPGAATDAGLAAATGCGAPLAAAGGAAEAACDDVAGLCADAGALAIAVMSAIVIAIAPTRRIFGDCFKDVIAGKASFHTTYCGRGKANHYG